MNIYEAKQEIKHAVKAYLHKDEDGSYSIPSIRQRPILLMGPPGIGKTAIMEQVADECQVALVSYTITHHTRQSAIGLPFISHKSYGGKEYTITEYTMSEIIASVYEKMEETKLSEGILFIDEINCVSETLAPTMLQFLQRKSFGSHFVPKGWLIVAAGNPPEYNKSVRDFDIVTLDRLKRIDIQENFDVWKRYAYKQHIHPAIISYLEIKKQNFYVIETTVEGRAFVTARGWEDLSCFLQTSEELKLPVNENVVMEYLQHENIARDFAAYYDLFRKYQSDYHVDAILQGKAPVSVEERLKEAPFDERLSVLGLLMGKLGSCFSSLYYKEQTLSLLFDALKEIRDQQAKSSLSGQLSFRAEQLRQSLQRRKTAALVDKKEAAAIKNAAALLDSYSADCKNISGFEESFALIRNKFNGFSGDYEEDSSMASVSLENVFFFLENTFGKGQEMVVFVTELNTDIYATWFISENGSAAYGKWNRELMIGRQKGELLEDIKRIL